MCQLYFNKTGLKKETKPAKWSLLRETKPYLTWVSLNKYLLIFFRTGLQRDRFWGIWFYSLTQETITEHFLRAGCPFWRCGWTTSKTKKALALVEFLLQEGLWGRGRQTEISTREPPGEGWRTPAGCLSPLGTLQIDFKMLTQKENGAINASTSLVAKHQVKREHFEGSPFYFICIHLHKPKIKGIKFKNQGENSWVFNHIPMLIKYLWALL